MIKRSHLWAISDQGAWQGGVNIETLDGAERYSYAGYKYFKSKAPQPKHLTLNSTHLGTCKLISILSNNLEMLS